MNKLIMRLASQSVSAYPVVCVMWQLSWSSCVVLNCRMSDWWTQVSDHDKNLITCERDEEFWWVVLTIRFFEGFDFVIFCVCKTFLWLQFQLWQLVLRLVIFSYSLVISVCKMHNFIKFEAEVLTIFRFASICCCWSAQLVSTCVCIHLISKKNCCRNISSAGYAMTVQVELDHCVS